MKEPEPIFTADLFPLLDAELIDLLNGLSDEDWQRPTVCSMWSVKDIAAHLLDSNIRRLSMGRDGYFGDKPENLNSHQDLVGFLNRLNADWVKAMKRISPKMLTALLKQTGDEFNEYFRSLDPFETAIFPVAWAGEEKSANWFDIARDYSEKWHHQQQIRLAVNKPGIMSRKLYYPVLDAFMRALPPTYKSIDAAEGTLLKFHITGEAGGVWHLLKHNGDWKLLMDAEGGVRAEVFIDQNIAWRLFTKGIDKESARSEMKIIGDEDLGSVITNMLSVMA